MASSAYTTERMMTLVEEAIHRHRHEENTLTNLSCEYLGVVLGDGEYELSAQLSKYTQVFF